MTSCEARAEIDIAHKSKVGWIQCLIRSGIMQYCLGVNARPVCECAWGGYRHIKGNGEIEALRYKLIERCQLCQIVGSKLLRMMNVEFHNQATKMCNTIALAYSHHR